MAASAKRMSAWPLARWAVCIVLPALAAQLLPRVGEVMIYDRSAIITGEMWRLLTGHWVHFSASHLFFDVAVLGITTWMIEFRGYRYVWSLCLLSALSISLVMLVWLPDMAFYGGLSGIAMANTVYIGLHRWQELEPWRAICLLVLLLSIARLVFDATSGYFALVNVEDMSIVPVPLSHFVGSASGAIVYLCSSIFIKARLVRGICG